MLQVFRKSVQSFLRDVQTNKRAKQTGKSKKLDRVVFSDDNTKNKVKKEEIKK